MRPDRVALRTFPNVHDYHHALPAYFTGGFRDQVRIRHSCCTDGNLLDAETNQTLKLFDARHATSVTKRHAALRREVLDERVVRFSLFDCGIDINDHQLIDFFLIENPDGVNRIADILRSAEIDRLDQPPAFNQQTWNDAWT